MRPACLLAVLALAAAGPVAAEEPTARHILERAVEAAGGESWLNPRTLVLEGEATFYAPDSPVPKSRADDYRMWRAMNPDRTVSHGADGKVRITAKSGDRLLFEVGFDGIDTWTEHGLMPKAEADAYWASNFGFGIIRSALKPGFRLERAPDAEVGGHPVYMVRLIDPQGQATLFGIDRKSHYIRSMEFMTPRGWHMRTYEDFVKLADPPWLQAREVTLFYNGVKANAVRWTRVAVNGPVPDALFRWPGAGKEVEK